MRSRLRDYHYFIYTFLSLLLGSCSVEKQDLPPCLEIETTWLTETPTLNYSGTTFNWLWWEALGDPILTDLVEKAVVQNLELQVIASRVAETRRLAHVTEASRLPHLDASLNTGKAGFNQGVLRNLLGYKDKGNKQKNISLFEAGFDAEWEIDLFGWRKHEHNATQAQYEATKEELHAGVVVLASEVARAYIEFRGIQKQTELARARILAQQDVSSLTTDLQKSGLVSIFDQWDAENTLGLLQAELPNLELSGKKALFKLSVLIGRQPQELIGLLNAPCETFEVPTELPVSLPCELLRQRPDIRQAEKLLQAAYEKTKSAEANLYPRLSLVGFIGDVTTKITKPGLTWYTGPSILAPIFNSKLLQEDLALNQEKFKQAFLNYQISVLQALEETESAIASYDAAVQRQTLIKTSFTNSRQAYEQSLVLYQRGLKNYLEVSVFQERLIQAERSFVDAKTETAKAYIAIYKALGGGFCTVSIP